MARAELFFDASPEQVFAVLSDPFTYDRWVVGTRNIRHADPNWPETGSRLHHSVGIGPLNLNDDSEVLDVDPPNKLVLEARGRPFGVARVEFRIDPDKNGSCVTIDEFVLRPMPVTLLNPVLAPAVRARNTETLRRLATVVGKNA